MAGSPAPLPPTTGGDAVPPTGDTPAAPTAPTAAERVGEALGGAFTRAERRLRRAGRVTRGGRGTVSGEPVRSAAASGHGGPQRADESTVVQLAAARDTRDEVVEPAAVAIEAADFRHGLGAGAEPQHLRLVSDLLEPGAGTFAGLASAWAETGRRIWMVFGALMLVLLLGAIFLMPGTFARNPEAFGGLGREPQAGVLGAALGTGPAAVAGTGAAATAQTGADAAAPGTPMTSRQLLFAALPLLLGLFWLLSAWLVDSEARRAFVVQEPWGERRTVAYTVLAVCIVFPLILAGLLFSAWGFVTFVMDVARRQSALAGLQAGAVVLIICAGFLVLRGFVARWIESRRLGR